MFPKNPKKKKILDEEDEDEIENTREYQVISNALGQDASEFNAKIEEQISILNNFRLKTNEITNLKITINDDSLKKTDQSKANSRRLTQKNEDAQIMLLAASAAAPDDDGDDKQNAASDLLIPQANKALMGLQYDGEINVNEIKQVEFYYEKIKNKKFKMDYETGELHEIKGNEKNRFQYLGVWSSISGSILVGRAFLPLLGGGLKSVISSLFGQEGSMYEFSEKLAKGIPFGNSETIGGISGINAYINIYFFLNATTQALQNGNPDYVLRYLAQNASQKVFSMILFNGLPLLVGMTSMPVLLSSVVASALPFLSPLSAITQSIFTSNATQMGVSMGAQWVGTMIMGEFMNYRFKELAEYEQMQKEISKKQQSDKRKRESFKKMLKFMEEQKHDLITDRLIRGEYNLMDKIKEVANDNSGLIGFLLCAVGMFLGFRQMGLFDSIFWKQYIVSGSDALSGKLEELLDINTKTFPDQLKTFLIPIIQKSLLQHFEIREKIQKRVNQIIREKVIPYLKEFHSIEKLSKWKIFKEIKILRYILIEKMQMKSLEYYTVEKLFESITTNNITQMVYGGVEKLATDGIQYEDADGNVRHVFGSLINPATYFGATEQDLDGHWAEGSVSRLKSVSTMIGNQWVSGFNDLDEQTQQLGRLKRVLGRFQPEVARWSGTETGPTQQSDADVLQKVVGSLWKDGIIPHYWNLDSIQTVDDLKSMLSNNPPVLSPELRSKYSEILPISEISIEQMRILLQTPQFFSQEFQQVIDPFTKLKVHSDGGKRKINFDILFYGIYPESLLRKYYPGDANLDSKIQQGKAELQLIEHEYSETYKALKSWAPKLKPFWNNFSDFMTNSKIAAAKSIAVGELQTAQDGLIKANERAALAKQQSNKQIEEEALAALSKATENLRIAQAEVDSFAEAIYDGVKQSIPDDIDAYNTILNMSKSVLKFYLPKSFFEIKNFVLNGFYLDTILTSLKNMFLDFWKNPSSVKLNMSAQEYLQRMSQLCSKTDTFEDKSCDVFAFEKLIEDTQVPLINSATWKNLSDQDKLAFFNSYFSFRETGDFNFLLTNFKEYLDPKLLDKMLALQTQGITTFPSKSDKAEDALPFYDAFSRPIFKKASDMGDFQCIGSASQFIDNIYDFFKQLTGSGFDAEFTRNTMRLYGTVGRKSDPRFLSELGIPITQGEKKGDVSYVLSSLTDLSDFKGVVWENLSGPEGEAKAALFVEYMKHHAYVHLDDMPFDLNKFSKLLSADKLKAVQLYFKLFNGDKLPPKTDNEPKELTDQRLQRESERKDIFRQLSSGIFTGVFKINILTYILDEGTDYDKFYNFFTGAFFKTYKTSGNDYSYTGFRKLVEKQRVEITAIGKRMKFFAENYCNDNDEICRQKILKPEDNVSLTNHIQFLERAFAAAAPDDDGDDKRNKQKASYIFMIGKVDLSLNTDEIISQLESTGHMNIEQQIAYFEKQVGKLSSIRKKRIDYLKELIDTYKIKRKAAVDKLKPIFCTLGNNCEQLYDALNFRFIKDIDLDRLIHTQLEADVASFERLNLVQTDLGTFLLNFRGNSPEELQTFENLIANFSGHTPEEFQTYIQHKAVYGTPAEKDVAAKMGKLLPITVKHMALRMEALIGERDALQSHAEITPEENQKITDLNKEIDALASEISKSGLKELTSKMNLLIQERDMLKSKPSLTQAETQKLIDLTTQIDAITAEIISKYGSAIRGIRNTAFAQGMIERFQYTADGFIIVNTDEGTAEEKASIADILAQKDQDANIAGFLSDWDITEKDLPDDFKQLPFSQKMTIISNIIIEKTTFIRNLPEFILSCILNTTCKPETFVGNQKRLQYPLNGSSYKQIMSRLRDLYSEFRLNIDTATPTTLEKEVRDIYGGDIELLFLKAKYNSITVKDAASSLINCDWVYTGDAEDELAVFKAYDSLIQSLKKEYDDIPSKFPNSFTKEILSKPFDNYKPHEFKRALTRLNQRVLTYDDKCAFLVSKGVSMQCAHDNEQEVLNVYDSTKEEMETLIVKLRSSESIIGSGHTDVRPLTLQELKDKVAVGQKEVDDNFQEIYGLINQLGVVELPESMTQTEKINVLRKRYDAVLKETQLLEEKMASSSIFSKKMAQIAPHLPIKDRRVQLQTLWTQMTTDAIIYGYKGDTKALSGHVFDETLKRYQNGFLDKLVQLAETGYEPEVKQLLQGPALQALGAGIDISGMDRSTLIAYLKSVKENQDVRLLEHLSFGPIMNAESKLKLILELQTLVKTGFEFTSSGSLEADLEKLKQLQALMLERIDVWTQQWHVPSTDLEMKTLTEKYIFLKNVNIQNAAVVSSMNALGFFEGTFEENAEGLAKIKLLFNDARFTTKDGPAEQIVRETNFPNPAVQFLIDRIKLFDDFSKKYPDKKSIIEYEDFEKKILYKVSKVSKRLTAVQSGGAEKGNVLYEGFYYKITDVETVFETEIQNLILNIESINSKLSEKFRIKINLDNLNDFDYLKTLSTTLSSIEAHQADIQQDVIRQINILGLTGIAEQQNCKSTQDIENCLQQLLQTSKDKWKQDLKKLKSFYNKDLDIDNALKLILESSPAASAKMVNDFNKKFKEFEKTQSQLIAEVFRLNTQLEIVENDDLRTLTKDDLDNKIGQLTKNLSEKQERIKKLLLTIGQKDILVKNYYQNQTLNKQIEFLEKIEKDLNEKITQKLKLFEGLDVAKSKEGNLTTRLQFFDDEYAKQSALYEKITGTKLLPNVNFARQFEIISYQYSPKIVELLKQLCGKKPCYNVETLRINGKDLNFLIIDDTVKKYIRSDALDDKFTPTDELIRIKLDRLKPFHADRQKYIDFILNKKPAGFSVSTTGVILFQGQELSNYDLLTGDLEKGEWQMGKWQMLDGLIRNTIDAIRAKLSSEKQQHFKAMAENKIAIDQLEMIEDIAKTEDQLAAFIKDQIDNAGGSFMLRSINFKSTDFDKNSNDYNPELVSMFYKYYTQLLQTVSSEFPNNKRIKKLLGACDNFEINGCINLETINSFVETLNTDKKMSNYFSMLRFFEVIDYQFDEEFFMMSLSDQSVVLNGMIQSIEKSDNPLFVAAQSNQYGKFMLHIDKLTGSYIETEFDEFVKGIIPSMPNDYPNKNSLQNAFAKIDESVLSESSKRQAKYNVYIFFQKFVFFQSTSDSSVETKTSDLNAILDPLVASEIDFGNRIDSAQKKMLSDSPKEKQEGQAELDAIEKARKEQSKQVVSRQLDYLIGYFNDNLPFLTDFTNDKLSPEKHAELNAALSKLNVSGKSISLDDPENGMMNITMSVSEFIKYATLKQWSREDIIKKLIPIVMDFPLVEIVPPDEANLKGAIGQRIHQTIHDAFKRSLLKLKAGAGDISDSDARQRSMDEIAKTKLDKSDLDNFLIISKSITAEGWNDNDIQTIVSDVHKCLDAGHTDCFSKEYLLDSKKFMNFAEIYLKGYELLIKQFGNTKDDVVRLRAEIAEAIESSVINLARSTDPITAQLQISAMKGRLQELDAVIILFGTNEDPKSGWFKDLANLFGKDKNFSEKNIKDLFRELYQGNGNLLNRYNQLFGKFASIFQRQQTGLEILASLSTGGDAVPDGRPPLDSKTDAEKANEFADDVASSAESLEQFAKDLRSESDKAGATDSNKADAAKKAEQKAKDFRAKAQNIKENAETLAKATTILNTAESDLSNQQGKLDALRQNKDAAPDAINAAEEEAARAQRNVDAAAQNVSIAKSEFDKNKDDISPPKNEIDDLKKKYPYIFQSKNIGILFDTKIQESILNRLNTDQRKSAERFFKRYFQQGKSKIINWEDLKNDIVVASITDSTIEQIISMTNTTTKVINRSMTDVLIRQIEINGGKTLTQAEKDRLYKHIEQQQLADETKFKNPLMETYVECLVEPNGRNCFIPTVQAIVLQTATRGLMELFKNLTVSNFASLGAISKAFQYVSVVSSTYEALADATTPTEAAATAPPKTQDPQIRVRLADKDAARTRSGDTHFSYIWMTPKQQRTAGAETDVRNLRDNTYIIRVEKGRKPATKEEQQQLQSEPKVLQETKVLQEPKVVLQAAPKPVKVVFADKDVHPTRSGDTHFSTVVMTPKQQRMAAAEEDVHNFSGDKDDLIVRVKPARDQSTAEPKVAEATKEPKVVATTKEPKVAAIKEPKIAAKDQSDVVEIDGKKFERKSAEEEHFVFNPKENFRNFAKGLKASIIGKNRESLTKTDREFEEEQLREKMDAKSENKDDKFDIKFQKKDGKIQEDSASVNGKDDQKPEKIEGFDFTEYKERFLNYYQSSKIYTYVHKPLQSVYEGMVDLKNWRPISVRDFITNWRSIPMVPLAILGQIYKGMTWLNAKCTKFANALGDLTTEFVKSMAKWVEDSAKLLISQITITTTDGQEQAIFGFGKILDGASKIVSKIATNGGKNADRFAEYVGQFVKQKTRNFVFDIAEDKILGKNGSGWLRWSFDMVKTGVLKIVGAVNFISDKLDDIQNALASKSASMWNAFVGINLVESFGKMIADVVENIPQNINENEPTDDQKEQLGKAFEKAGKIITPFVDAIQGILKPGGISRFVYIMIRNKEAYENYIVFGRQDIPEMAKWIRQGILHFMESVIMKLAVVSDLAVSIVMNVGNIMKSLVSNGIDVIKGFFEQIMNAGSFFASGVGRAASGSLPARPEGSQMPFQAQTPSEPVKFSISGFRRMWSAISNLTSDFLNAFTEIFQVFKVGVLRWVDTAISDDWWGLGWVKNKVIKLAIPQNFDTTDQNKYNFLAAGGYRNRKQLLIK